VKSSKDSSNHVIHPSHDQILRKACETMTKVKKIWPLINKKNENRFVRSKQDLGKSRILGMEV
jgi:hypothetical protein